MDRLMMGCGRSGVVAFLVAALGACGPSGSDYCEDRRDCMGASEADEDACNEYFDYHTEMADIQGCRDEFDDYFECFFDKAKCLTDDTNAACVDTEGCRQFGYGAKCQDDTCQVKDLGLQGVEDCAALKQRFEQCSTLDRAPFGA
jgi:hypothetical protein